MTARTVLIVEDQAILRTLLKKYLSQGGFSVEEAANGVDALQRLTRPEPVDVIVLDVRMPRMDGMQTAARLRQLPAHVATPILFCTATPPDELTVPDSAKPFGVLHKPFEHEEILSSVAHVLQNQSA